MSACHHCGADLGDTGRHYCDSTCRNAGKAARAAAGGGGMTKRRPYPKLDEPDGEPSWHRRLRENIEQGVAREGSPAVRAAVAAIFDELGIVGRAGHPAAPIPDLVVKGAKRYIDAVCADPPRQPPTEGQMAQTAQMSGPGFRKWWHGERRTELLAAALAKHMDDASK